MKVRIQTIDGQPLPQYESKGAVCFDLSAREETVIGPRSLGLVPTGVIIEVPEGYAMLLAARSSTPKKKGLLMPHGMGIIDQDYNGPKDENLLQFYNFTDEPVTIEKGERIGQALLVKIGKAEWERVDQISDHSRGGFGSTD